MRSGDYPVSKLSVESFRFRTELSHISQEQHRLQRTIAYAVHVVNPAHDRHESAIISSVDDDRAIDALQKHPPSFLCLYA